MLHAKAAEADTAETDTAKADAAEIDPFLRLPEVELATGLGKSSIYKLVKLKKFPPPKDLGCRAVGWRRSIIRGWQDSRPDARAIAA